MKKLSYLIVLTLILGLVLTGCLLSNVGQVPATEQSGITYLTKHTEDAPQVTDLLAGQTNKVGEIFVWNDADYLYVKYIITDLAWCLTETHVHVGEGLVDFPLAGKQGNPVPGQFDYSDPHGCVPEYTYEISLGDWGVGDELIIAAHAVVIKVIGEGCEFPFWATEHSNYLPGFEVDGDPIQYDDPDDLLGAPNAELHENEPAYWTGFVSLGFGGSVIVNFDYPIYNSPGDYDISVHEVTGTSPAGRASYPEESVEVYVISDGVEYFAGRVTNHDDNGIGKISIPGGIPYVDAVKFIDTTVPSNFPTPPYWIADAYDIDAVDACYLVEQEETAWGAGTRFTPRGNWATYFTYKVQGWHLVETLIINANSTTGADSTILESGKSYMFKAMGTWRDASQSNHYIDAEYTTFDSWTTRMDGTTNWGPDQKDLQVNETFVDWVAYSSDHVYTLMFNGADLTVNFRIFDGWANATPPVVMTGWYGDNKGFLTVEIYEWH